VPGRGTNVVRTDIQAYPKLFVEPWYDIFHDLRCIRRGAEARIFFTAQLTYRQRATVLVCTQSLELSSFGVPCDSMKSYKSLSFLPTCFRSRYRLRKLPMTLWPARNENIGCLTKRVGLECASSISRNSIHATRDGRNCQLRTEN